MESNWNQQYKFRFRWTFCLCHWNLTHTDNATQSWRGFSSRSRSPALIVLILQSIDFRTNPHFDDGIFEDKFNLKLFTYHCYGGYNAGSCINTSYYRNLHVFMQKCLIGHPFMFINTFGFDVKKWKTMKIKIKKKT